MKSRTLPLEIHFEIQKSNEILISNMEIQRNISGNPEIRLKSGNPEINRKYAREIKTRSQIILMNSTLA